MFELNENNFDDNVKDGLVLVDFYTTWCGPCKLMTPVLEKLTDVKVYKVDAEENRDLASDFSVSAVPCLIFFKDGVEVDRITGLQSETTLKNKIKVLNENN